MSNEELKKYIGEKLKHLGKSRDMEDISLRGKLSFGVSSADYGHLPSWNKLVKQKRSMKKWMILDAIFLPLILILYTGDYFDKFPENWLRATASLVLICITLGFFIFLIHAYTTFYRFRLAEREIRKLIYEDIIDQMDKDQKHQ